LTRFALVQTLQREKDLAGLAPKRGLIPAEPVNAGNHHRPSQLVLVIAAVIIVCEFVKYYSLRTGKPVGQLLGFSSMVARWSMYYSAAMLLMLFGGNTSRQFIYFQF
jgi:hypothetical protein